MSQWNLKKFKYSKPLAITFVCLFSTTVKAETKSAHNEQKIAKDIIIVEAPKGLTTSLDNEGIQKVKIDDKAPSDFGKIIRYQTLISAPSVGQGVSSSSFDRGGYKGYNVRGLEGNRVAIDVNGIPLPDATGRSYGSRKGKDTFSIGRDYIDPYMYRELSIETGASSANKSNGTIGGAVSFLSKAANDYLTPTKNFYTGYQGDYDSTDKSFHNGFIFAGKDGDFDALMVLSRRDGKESRVNNYLSPYPKVWHSNALLTRGGWQINEDNLVSATFDYYQRHNREAYSYWKIHRNNPALNKRINAKQQGTTERYSYELAHNWTPAMDNFDGIYSRLFYQYTHANDATTIFESLPPYEYIDSALNVNLYGFENKSGYQWHEHHLTFGINGLLSTTTRPFYQQNAQNLRAEIMRPEADSQRYRFEAFVKNQFNFFHQNIKKQEQRFVFEPGLRFVLQQTKARHLEKMVTNNISLNELDTLYGDSSSDSFLLPSLLLNYQLANNSDIYARYQRGVQFPNASQLYGSWNLNQNGLAPTSQYALIGNINLEPETSHSFEIGFTDTTLSSLEIGSSIFYNKYKNFIASNRYNRLSHSGMFDNVPSHIGTIFKTENRDAAYIYGLEINTKVDWSSFSKKLSGFSSRFAIGYSKGKSKSDYSGDKYVDLESVAPIKLVLGLNWDAPQQDYGFAIISTIQKGKQAKDTGRESYDNTPTSTLNPTTNYYRIPGYGIVDISAYWQVTKGVRFNGGIYNLTDRRYWDYSTSHSLSRGSLAHEENFMLSTQPDRTFYLGVNLDF